MNKKLLVASGIAFTFLGAGIGVQHYISSQIASNVEQEIPKASGVSASVPLIDIPSNLSSDVIKSAEINVESFPLKDGAANTSLGITASNISKTKPNLIGSLDLIATIPASAVVESSGFDSAEIVGSTLQVAAGAGGLGTAILIPKYSNGQLYFALQSLSILGNQIPAASLPPDLQNQIKTKSERPLTPPKGLKVKSVSISSKGLSIKMSGSNIKLGNLGSGL